MIKAETLTFIKDVAEHNDREWFALNKDRYDESRADVLDFIDELIPLLASTDPSFSIDTPAKKC